MDHDVRVFLGGAEQAGAGGGTSFQVEQMMVTNDMLAMADPFALELPFDEDLWALATPDSLAQVFIDESCVLTGYIDERTRQLSKSGGTIALVGRDKGGRMEDESAPLQSLAGLDIQGLAHKMAGSWFPQVTLSNAKNRALVKGRGRRSARIGAEPGIQSPKDAVQKVDPGTSRASVLGYFLERAGLLAWSSANGREFIVGRPNHNQAPQWVFTLGLPGGQRQTNVIDFEYAESVADRYARILVVGGGRGTKTNYGKNTRRLQATLRNDRDFQFPKTLIVQDEDIRSIADAKQRAEREFRVREATARRLTVTVPGFGQVLGGAPGAPPAIFTFDTVAHWDDEEAGIGDDWLVTRVVFHLSKTDGPTTELEMVPVGTELQVS